MQRTERKDTYMEYRLECSLGTQGNLPQEEGNIGVTHQTEGIIRHTKGTTLDRSWEIRHRYNFQVKEETLNHPNRQFMDPDTISMFYYQKPIPLLFCRITICKLSSAFCSPDVAPYYKSTDAIVCFSSKLFWSQPHRHTTSS